MILPLIVIDPGHGGSDPGAVGPHGEKESVVTMRAAKMLATRLEPAGVLAELTRTDDSYVALRERARLANTLGADALISLHANAAEAEAAHGFEVWTSPGETGADDLAFRILAEVESRFPELRIRKSHAETGPDKEARFSVLIHTRMPAVLIEMGFITNLRDCAKLQDNQWLGRLMDSVTNATVAWLYEGRA